MWIGALVARGSQQTAKLSVALASLTLGVAIGSTTCRVALAQEDSAFSQGPEGASESGDAEPGELLVARTSPQWHVALAPGVCALDGATTGLRFCGALSGHVLLGRARDSDWGWGPYVRTVGVLSESVSLAVGGSALLPVNPTFPFIVSLGALGSYSAGSLQPGLELSLFFGPSVYNFHSAYSMASGILVGAQRTWGSNAGGTLFVTLQIDMAWLSLPVIALIEVLRGPPQR